MAPLAGDGRREGSRPVRARLEAVLVALAIVVLVPPWGALERRDAGRDARYATAATAAPEATAPSETPLPQARAGAQAAKDEAMRALLRTARWQWAGAAVLGLALLALARTGVAPAIGAGIALAAWAVAAYVARVPWPFGGTTPTFARETTAMPSMPAGFVVAMLAVAAVLLAVAHRFRARPRAPRFEPGSAFGYPGLAAATGLGFLVLLDLSANGTPANRYLALYHHGHFWLAMTVFSLVAMVRAPVARWLAWTLALVDAAAGRLAGRIGAASAGALILAAALAATAVGAVLLANTRQVTSELGRLWLIVGAAWFFYLRGTPLTERIARSGSSVRSLARYVAPLAFVVAVLVAAMVLTRDLGPLLVAGYGAGAFVAASIAMWSVQRGRPTWLASALALSLFVAWIVATTTALFRFGAMDPVTAARLENVAVPLASANDQLALVTWFQRASPPAGFGPGAVPWCGFGASDSCAGVPAQIQSDYTFTALVGMFGWTGAWLATIGCTLWLILVARAHGRATRGEPRLVRANGRLVADAQAFAGWLAVAWVAMTLCQLAVTVAGNLAVIPLTGVTFPFVSFGMTSLTVNLAMLALAIDVARPGTP